MQNVLDLLGMGEVLRTCATTSRSCPRPEFLSALTKVVHAVSQCILCCDIMIFPGTFCKLCDKGVACAGVLQGLSAATGGCHWKRRDRSCNNASSPAAIRKDSSVFEAGCPAYFHQSCFCEATLLTCIGGRAWSLPSKPFTRHQPSRCGLLTRTMKAA